VITIVWKTRMEKGIGYSCWDIIMIKRISGFCMGFLLDVRQFGV
jgi:hypothetical protein